METTDKTDNTARIADLKRKWSQLKDVDRARAIHKIHLNGASFRSLAKDLNCSPTLIRDLNVAAQAPLPDQFLARQGTISTRELVRRAKAELARNASQAGRTIEHIRNERAAEVAKAICDLIDRMDWTGGFGECVVKEARFYLANAEAQLQVPAPPPELRDLPLDRLLERVRPRYKDADAIDAEPCAEWLVRFVLAALPDSMSRHHALNLALDIQNRR